MPEDREQRAWSSQSWAESSVYCSFLIQLPSWWRKPRCACPIHLTALLKVLAESFCQYQGIYITIFPCQTLPQLPPSAGVVVILFFWKHAVLLIQQ